MCKENFGGERCELRVAARSQRLAFVSAAIGGVVAILVIIVIIIWMISFRFNRQPEPEKPVEPDTPSNFLYGRPTPQSATAARPIAYYYEDDDDYDMKTMYVSDDDSKEVEQRLRHIEQHMYRPSTTAAGDEP